MEGLLGFVLAGFALAGSPGPATLSLAATGAAFGARGGLGYMLGIVLGMIGVMGITGTGLTGLLMAMPGATPLVAILAAAYFVHLAWRIATAPPLSASSHDGRRPSFAAGVLLSLVNPKGYAAMAALLSGFVLVRDRVALDLVLKVAVLAAVIVTVNVAWLAMGGALTRHFREPGPNRVINVTFAILLLASLALPFIV
jgi:threonine/homoserine/homoserine lactone efflux protein